MAKEININPFILLGASVFLLAGGWLMKSFPIFLLFGYAPLFALTDRISDKKPFWNQFEYILVALCLSLFAAHQLRSDSIMNSIIEGIALTLPFIAYGFVRQSLGNRTGKFTIIFFWLAAEYVFLKTPWRENLVFLGDGLILFPHQMNFTCYTGYLGISLWILISNLLIYLTIIKEKAINYIFLILASVLIAAPLVFSLMNESEPITRESMLQLYGQSTVEVGAYQLKGEWTGRTAAWVSVLILLLSLVKNKIQKK